MCEVVEEKNNNISCRCLRERSWAFVQFRKFIKFLLYGFASNVLCGVVMGLEYIIRTIKIMKGVGNVSRTNRASQTLQQDIVQIMTHHFSALHEHNYINSIMCRHNWNCLKRDVICIKEALSNNKQDSILNNLNLIDSEVRTIKEMMLVISKRVDRITSVTPAPSNCFIPPPPPMPPPGFILHQEERDLNGQTNSKKVFGSECPPRPIITVETLKQVKLKKVPPANGNKQNNDDKVSNDDHVKSTKVEKLKLLRKRPKTTDQCRSSSKAMISSSWKSESNVPFRP